METIKKMTHNLKQVDQVVKIMIILIILMNMTVQVMEAIYYRISII